MNSDGEVLKDKLTLDKPKRERSKRQGFPRIIGSESERPKAKNSEYKIAPIAEKAKI